MNNNHEKLKSDVCYVCGKVCHAEYLVEDNLLCEECGRVVDKLNGQMERFKIEDNKNTCKLCECLLKEEEIQFCEDCRFMLTEGFKVNEGIFR